MQASFLLGTYLHDMALQAKIKLFNEYENICTGTLLEDSKIYPSAVFTREELSLIEDQTLVLIVIITMAIVFNITILTYILEI